ncbi:hypothetical protein AHAS_Ahas15G0174700 [Arachis hypogaea]
MYLINRMPSSVISNKSLFKILIHAIPDYTALVCLVICVLLIIGLIHNINWNLDLNLISLLVIQILRKVTSALHKKVK